MCRRRVMTTTAIAPPMTAPQIAEPAAPDLQGAHGVVVEELVVGDHVVDARTDDAPDHDPERDVVDPVPGVAAVAPALLGDVDRDQHADGEDDAVHVERAEVAARGAGDRAEQRVHRPLIARGGRRSPRPSKSRRFCRYHPHAPGTAAARDRHDRGDRARRVPPDRRPAPAPAPTTTRAMNTTTTTQHDTTTRPPVSGAWAQNGSLGIVSCFPRRQPVEPRRLGRCPSTPTRRATSPPSPRSAATRSSTPTSAAPARTASRTSPCPGPRRGSPSTSWRTATRATPARIPSR